MGINEERGVNMQIFLEIGATVVTIIGWYCIISAVIGIAAASYIRGMESASDGYDLMAWVLVVIMIAFNWPIMLYTLISEKIGFWAREHLDLGGRR